jgi:hypothetical protein
MPVYPRLKAILPPIAVAAALAIAPACLSLAFALESLTLSQRLAKQRGVPESRPMVSLPAPVTAGIAIELEENSKDDDKAGLAHTEIPAAAQAFYAIKHPPKGATAISVETYGRAIDV